MYIFILAFLFACFMATAYMFNIEISFQRAAVQALASLAGLFLFALLFLFLRTTYHIHRRVSYKNVYQAFFNEIEETVDRISKGDFDARIDVDVLENMMVQHNTHISDLVERINHMAEELGEMETMRQDFVSNVSHEIQSPLTSIRGFVSLLKDDSLSKEERLKYIGIIESESLRLSKLSENLLRLSMLESENSEVNSKTYSLSKQLKDAILLFEPQWSGKDIEVSLDDLHNDTTDIYADEELLNQVWINLLNNSIKFTPAGGKISISVFRDETLARITISDSGIGMSEETKTHIFERFYMADKARGRNAGGNGLGLSIVKKIIQMHHGDIDVNSKPGEGTSIIVTIPIPKKTK